MRSVVSFVVVCVLMGGVALIAPKLERSLPRSTQIAIGAVVVVALCLVAFLAAKWSGA